MHLAFISRANAVVTWKPATRKPAFMPPVVAVANLLLAAASSTSTSAQDQPAPCTPGPWTEVVMGRDLMNRATLHLGDVFAFSTAWHATSTDGYHWQATPAGLSPSQERWTIHLDDIPVGPRILGRSQLQTLPISASDVACIELVEGLGAEQVGVTRSGSIRIYTKAYLESSGTGLSVDGGVTLGNEINDPGPFRYTDLGGTNVDRIGPVGSTGVTVRGQNWVGRASARLEEHHVTDEALTRRAQYLYIHDNLDTNPRIQAGAVGFTSSLGPSHRRQHVIGGITHTADLDLFPSIGHEIPLIHRGRTIGWAGHLHAVGSSLRYAVSRSVDALEERPNRIDIEPDWRQDRLVAHVEIRGPSVRVGGALHDIRVHTTQRLSDSRLSNLLLFAGLGSSTHPRWRRDLMIAWNRRGPARGGMLQASTSLRLGQRQWLTFSGSYGHAPTDAQGLWTWNSRGYTIPPYEAPTDEGGGAEATPRLLTTDAAWSRHGMGHSSAHLRLFYRKVIGEPLPFHEIAYDPETGGFDVETRLTPHAGGTTGASAQLDLRGSSKWRHRLAFTHEFETGSDSTWHELRTRVPATRIAWIATLIPSPRLTLTMQAKYTSATRWPLFERASSQAEGAFPWKLPARVLVNVSATKRLWCDHLVFTLGLRNVLNEPARFHPAGGVFHMALHVATRIRFGSTPDAR